MCKEEISVSKKTLSKFKEIVDFIYEATVPEAGYVGSFNKYGTRFRYTVQEMVKRGILTRSVEHGHRTPTYRWFNASQHPTAPLKGIFTQLMREDTESLF